MSDVYMERELVPVKVRRYRWPELLLAVLLLILFMCGAIVLGSFAYFTAIQRRLFIMVPWYYYFLLAISTLTILFVFSVVALYYVHLLLPIIVMISSFIMFVLWLTGLIKASIELWGPLGSINDNCVRYVYNDQFWGGRNLDTLARIQQEGVCNLWKTTFALEMISTFVFLWLILMSWQVISRARRGY
ncbi:hypothetical protein HOY82DRAFT_231549 [Tuber indicum]|nr:hypothetical protein HOY82DRAFT_231549 [Tuber indicum]